MTPNPKPRTEDKEQSPYSQMMKALADELSGPIPDGAAQGQAVKWLLTNYTVTECVMLLKEQMKETKAKGGWRSRVSWLTVKQEIGTWLAKMTGNGERVENAEESEESLSREEATELLAMLREDAERYGYQVEMIERMYEL